MRAIVRIIGVLVLLVSFIFAAMLSIGSDSSFLISVLAWAGLFSIISGIGILFLKNWARIYSLLFLSVATIVFLLEHIKEYSKFKFLPSLSIAIIFSITSLTLVVILLNRKIKEYFK